MDGIQVKKFKQEWVDAPTESGWWWYSDGQSICAMNVDVNKGIAEVPGWDKPGSYLKLRGTWQKAILPGNSVVTIQPPK